MPRRRTKLPPAIGCTVSYTCSVPITVPAVIRETGKKSERKKIEGVIVGEVGDGQWFVQFPIGLRLLKETRFVVLRSPPVYCMAETTEPFCSPSPKKKARFTEDVVDATSDVVVIDDNDDNKNNMNNNDSENKNNANTTANTSNADDTSTDSSGLATQAPTPVKKDPPPAPKKKKTPPTKVTPCQANNWGLGMPLRQPKLTELFAKSPEKFSFNTGSHADNGNWTPGFASAKAQADDYWRKVRKMKLKPIPADLPTTVATTNTTKNSIADCNLGLIPSPVAVCPKMPTPFDDNNKQNREGTDTEWDGIIGTNNEPNNHSDLSPFQVTQSQGDGSPSPPHPHPPACLKDDKAYDDPVEEADDEGGADDGHTVGTMDSYTMSDASVVVIDNDDVRAVYDEENNSLHVLAEADVNTVFTEGLGENLETEDDTASITSFFSATHSITSI